MSARPCPICGKPPVRDHAPFCSPRCKDVDLNRWLKEAYTIPVVEPDEPDEGEDDAPESGGRLH